MTEPTALHDSTLSFSRTLSGTIATMLSRLEPRHGYATTLRSCETQVVIPVFEPSISHLSCSSPASFSHGIYGRQG